jgi:protein-S-isoprenylcysteine O-methyltransferase Ste14
LKDLLRKQFGEKFFRWYRVFYNFFVSVTFLPILALVALLPDRTLYVLPFPWAWISVALQLLSAVVIGIGLLQSGLMSFLGLDALFGVKPAPQSLTFKGFYAWVRHPIYTAGLVFLWSTPVLTQNLFALNLALTLYILLGARLEERKMVAQFGEVYRRYQQRVPMFLPYRIPKPEELTVKQERPR